MNSENNDLQNTVFHWEHNSGQPDRKRLRGAISSDDQSSDFGENDLVTPPNIQSEETTSDCASCRYSPRRLNMLFAFGIASHLNILSGRADAGHWQLRTKITALLQRLLEAGEPVELKTSLQLYNFCIANFEGLQPSGKTSWQFMFVESADVEKYIGERSTEKLNEALKSLQIKQTNQQKKYNTVPKLSNFQNMWSEGPGQLTLTDTYDQSEITKSVHFSF